MKAKIYVLFLILSSCAGAPPLSPHFIDTDLMECREYEIVDREKLTIRKKRDLPIQACNGFFALPASEAAAWKRYYLKNKDKQCRTQ